MSRFGFGFDINRARRSGGPYPGATLALDLAGGYYRLNGTPYASASAVPGYNFSRASAGTAEALDGTLVTFPGTRTNLILHSQNFANAAWAKTTGGTGVLPIVTPNAAIAPDGTFTATKVAFDRGVGTTSVDGSYLSQFTGSAVTLTNSIYIRADAPTQVLFRNAANNGGWTYVSVTTAWQRVENSGIPATTTQFYVGLRGDQSPNVSATVYIWGAQVETGSAATAYIPTTTVAVSADTPRITNKGVLIEEARTNSFLNSDTGVTQGVTTTAASWTLQFRGTGSITLSGGATGTLTGTGVNNVVSLTVTATAAVTTLTVTGSCTNVQFEAGAFASSYIPTTGTAATRAADRLYYTGLGSLLAPPFTEVISVDLYQADGTLRRPLSLSDGTTANRLLIDQAVANSFGQTEVSGGVTQPTVPASPTFTGRVQAKVGVRLQATQATQVTNGGTVRNSAANTAPIGMNQIEIGQGQAGGGAYANGYIKSVAIYPYAMTDAQLQAATQ